MLYPHCWGNCNNRGIQVINSDEDDDGEPILPDDLVERLYIFACGGRHSLFNFQVWMNFNFLPSLKYMAAARIASRLILDPKIVRMTEEEKLPFFGKIFDCDRQDYWKFIEEKAEEILTPF
ncbi:hypothetical protein AVEN_165314-1 [Araneus ventricosus]|uniref:Uncharacterized protein n=1 Tax=Araneus ventricosus TaxID=182803 RepID=A0A4Y2ATD3_ARAVE|nr:hypothetical protein AVEN_165314-1 [Araneus ventricosus]